MVPSNWPSGILADALGHFHNLLREDPMNSGWYEWYAIDEPSGEPVAAGSIGFFGPPDVKGVIETGNSVLPQFHTEGLVSDMIRQIPLLVFSTGKVKCV